MGIKKSFWLILLIFFLYFSWFLSAYAQNIKSLFLEEDYEEIIGLLGDKSPSELFAVEAYYLGYSYLMVGELSKALKYLESAYAKTEDTKLRLTLAELIARIRFYQRDYREVLKVLGELPLDRLSDRGKYYLAIALIEVEGCEEAKKVWNAISSEKFRKRIKSYCSLREGTQFFGQTFQFYDSNIKLVEDTDITDTEGFITQAVISVRRFSPKRELNFVGFGRIQNDRTKDVYDVYLTNISHLVKGNNFKIVVPGISFVYTKKKVYSSSINTALSYNFKNYLLTINAGGEYNFETSDKNNYFFEGGMKVSLLTFRFKYKNYSNYYDRIAAVCLLDYDKRFGLKLKNYVFVSLGVEYTSYFDISESSLRRFAGLAIGRKIFKKGSIEFRGSYEINRLIEDNEFEGLERDYDKYVVGIGIKFVF